MAVNAVTTRLYIRVSINEAHGEYKESRLAIFRGGGKEKRKYAHPLQIDRYSFVADQYC